MQINFHKRYKCPHCGYFFVYSPALFDIAEQAIKRHEKAHEDLKKVATDVTITGSSKADS